LATNNHTSTNFITKAVMRQLAFNAVQDFFLKIEFPLPKQTLQQEAARTSTFPTTVPARLRAAKKF